LCHYWHPCLTLPSLATPGHATPSHTGPCRVPRWLILRSQALCDRTQASLSEAMRGCQVAR
jgi:hypothetical protein